MTELDDRPRYYEGQYLQAADLTAAVDYTSTQRARILVGAHRWGIALGMDLTEVPAPNGMLDVVLTPGYAWDGFGRPVLVAEPTKLPISLFAVYDAMVGAGPPLLPVAVEIWIRYDETRGQGPAPGFETCDPTSAFARVTERFVLEAGPRIGIAAQRDPIEVAGRTMDAAQALRAFDPNAPEVVDASIGHQSLPIEGEPAHWLVPVGVVTYQPGSPGRLLARDAPTMARHSRVRQYVGVVAGSVEAAAGVVRIHDRGKPYAQSPTGELLWVEGDTRCDGDLRIFGHRLEFVASPMEAPRAPFHVLRNDDLTANRTSLTLVIGDQQAGNNMLMVARKSGTDPAGRDLHEARMVVTDQGRVGIGTDTPKAPLHLPDRGLQVGTSPAATDNFHIQSTDGPRALRFFNGDTGAGVPLMSLTATGRLGIGTTDPSHAVHVRGAKGLRQESLYLSGDSRWSSVSFNAHHNEANSDWEFPDVSKPAVTIEMDAAGGFPRFQVYSTIPGDNRTWRSRLFVHGHTGNVGIGTTSPAEQLEVAGDVRFAGLAAVGSGTKVRVLWGAVSEAGGIDAGTGFTVSKPAGGGRYQITFSQPFTGQPTLLVSRVHLTLTANNGTSVTAAETAVVDQVLATGALVATANVSGARVDGGFTFLAIGPR